MPIYEYECIDNHHQFEQFQKITDGNVTTCIYCGSKVKRLISHTAFHLKGSGWYVTDYGKGSHACKGCSATTAAATTEKKCSHAIQDKAN